MQVWRVRYSGIIHAGRHKPESTGHSVNVLWPKGWSRETLGFTVPGDSEIFEKRSARRQDGVVESQWVCEFLATTRSFLAAERNWQVGGNSEYFSKHLPFAFDINLVDPLSALIILASRVGFALKFSFSVLLTIDFNFSTGHVQSMLASKRQFTGAYLPAIRNSWGLFLHWGGNYVYSELCHLS